MSKPDKFNPLGLGDVTIARQAFDSAFAEERERYGFVAGGRRLARPSSSARSRRTRT